MAITAKEVNKLRQMTGAGMMDCKKALTEAEGDFDKAIDILRKKGQKVSAARADRETTEGVVFVKTNDNKTEGLLIALGCETDFVAKNEEFQKLGASILVNAFANNSDSISDLMDSKLGDFTIAEKITELVGKIGEKIEITSYVKLSADSVVPYIHSGSKLGVLVGLTNTNGGNVDDAGKDVAMQIAAMNPIAVGKDSVDQAIIDKELSIGREQAIAEGKPEKIVEKIAEGKLNKYFQENTLLAQKFVKDNSVTIEKYLDGISSGLTVSEFKRVTIG